MRHQGEQLAAALLGDDLAQQRAQEADLAAERVAGTREPGAAGLRGHRREPATLEARFGPGGALGGAKSRGGGHPRKDARTCTGLSAARWLRFDCKGTVPIPGRNRLGSGVARLVGRG